MSHSPELQCPRLAVRRAREVPWLALMALVAAGALPLPLLSSGLLAQNASGSEGSLPAVLTNRPVETWVRAAADNEVRVIDQEGSFPLSYRTRKIDDRGDTTREVIESRDGAVARLVERDGHALTRQQDADEHMRLNDVLSVAPDAFRKHKRDNALRAYSTDLVHQFPESMLLSYVPGQPQTEKASGPEVVIDFVPKPGFKPPTLVTELLTGLEGRLWIDARAMRVVRAEARVIRPVSFGWGMLMRIHPGGTVVFEQTPVDRDRWAYSHVEDHLEIRAMMIHTAEQNVRMSAWNFRLLPTALSKDEAVRALLALPVPLQP